MYTVRSKLKEEKKRPKKNMRFFFKSTQNPKCTKGKEKKMYESLKRSFKGVLTREEEEREKGMCLHKRERECFEEERSLCLCRESS